jgi:hypothetical protein
MRDPGRLSVLVVHDVPVLGDAGSTSGPLHPAVTLSHVRASGLPALVAAADFVVVACALGAGEAQWSAAMGLVVARDIPMCTVKLLPSRSFCAGAVSGTCAMRVPEDGRIEVACLAQQAALERASARLRGQADPEAELQRARSRITRFIFQGD